MGAAVQIEPTNEAKTVENASQEVCDFFHKPD
jgi:hypothetical protein